MWAEGSTPQTTSFPGRLTEVRTPEAATRLQVRLRVGRLTLGLTVADRWECSQATGLPAWRHQDLHITANTAHGITGTQTEETVLRYWSRLDLVYEHVHGDSGRLRSRFASPRGGKNSPYFGDGLTIETYRCTYPGEQKSKQ